jgi:large subunit ribosomal protein L9
VQLILLQRVPNLGQMGDVVNVANGYGRNYLLPQKMALRASKENIALFDQRKKHIEADSLKRREEAERVAKKMAGLSVVLIRTASETGHLYGSVRPTDIAEAVTNNGFTIGRQQVVCPHPIKTLGLHKVHVRLHPEVELDVVVNIALSEEEAAIQAGKDADSE